MQTPPVLYVIKHCFLHTSISAQSTFGVVLQTICEH